MADDKKPGIVDDIMNAVKDYSMDPQVSAMKTRAREIQERNNQPSQYEKDLASGQAKQRFQKGFSGK